MLTAFSVHYGRPQPDENAGLVLVSPDGTRWIVGALTAKYSDTHDTTRTYDVRTETIWTHDGEGRRRLVRADCEAHQNRLNWEGEWCVESLDGEWCVYVAPLYDHPLQNNEESTDHD